MPNKFITVEEMAKDICKDIDTHCDKMVKDIQDKDEREATRNSIKKVMFNSMAYSFWNMDVNGDPIN